MLRQGDSQSPGRPRLCLQRPLRIDVREACLDLLHSEQHAQQQALLINQGRIEAGGEAYADVCNAGTDEQSRASWERGSTRDVMHEQC